MAKAEGERTLPYFSRRMAELREKAGLSFKDLERATDITDQALINIERRGAGPSLANAQAIARALGVPLAELLEEPTPPTPTLPATPGKPGRPPKTRNAPASTTDSDAADVAEPKKRKKGGAEDANTLTPGKGNVAEPTPTTPKGKRKKK